MTLGEFYLNLVIVSPDVAKATKRAPKKRNEKTNPIRELIQVMREHGKHK